jgi:hypothetical protein
MARAVKSLPQADPSQALAEQLKDARAAAQAFIETTIADLNREHPAVSVEWLKQNLYAVHHVKCDCRLALKLLEGKQ